MNGTENNPKGNFCLAAGEKRRRAGYCTKKMVEKGKKKPELNGPETDRKKSRKRMTKERYTEDRLRLKTNKPGNLDYQHP